MKFLQRLGKAIMFPVAALPLCGILMGIGYLLCPATMQGGDVSGLLPVIGLYLVKAGGALLDNIPLLFAVGVGVGLTDDRDGMAGLDALVAWLMITTLLKTDNVVKLLPSLSENGRMAFDKIGNPFIGIISGVVGALCYNRFKGTKLPEWLAFFSGKRCTVIVSGVAAILVSALLMAAWPIVFGGLTDLGKWIVEQGSVGAGIYAFLNRLLIPFGLHHALNNVFWFDTIGLGDLTHFWAGHTSADVSWSLGMYMSGFFPCMMFGVPGAALAMIRSAKSGKKKAAIGILAAGAVCAFVCGVTEPFEFAFMFAAPVLYVLYALLYGVFSWVTALVGFRAGFAFSAGATDLAFSASLPAAQNTWMILPLGAAAFVIFYVLFRVLITRFDLKTPGREEEEEPILNSEIRIQNEGSAEGEPSEETPAEEHIIESGYDITAILEGLGGKENITTLDNCATRLRVEVRDAGLVNDAVLKKAGARGVIRPGKNSVQVIIGTKVQQVAEALRPLIK